MADYQMQSRRAGKTLIAVEESRRAQRQGRRVLWATNNQGETAKMLSKHGALSEIVGENYVAPHFKEPNDD